MAADSEKTQATDAEMVKMLQEAIAAIPHPLCIYDANDRVLACSDKYRRIHSPAFVGLGKNLVGHDLRFEQVLRATYAEKVPADQVEARVQAELRRHRRPGGYIKDIHSEGRWYRRTKTVGPNGVVVGLSVSIDELIKKSEALEAVRSQLEHQAYHDPLTELSNRRGLNEYLREVSRSLVGTDELVALLHVDLDKFKAVNDTLGHDAGDQVLLEASRILKREVRTSDFVARVGGDEFVLVCRNIQEEADIARIAQRIVEKMKQPIFYGEEMCQIGASIGIALCSEGFDVSRIMMDADIALYEAKNKGRSCFEFFYPRYRDRFSALQKQVNAVREAMMLNAFEPFFQPQVCVRTGKILGMEALARWRDREAGVIPPGQFLHALDEARLMDELDTVMLRKSLKALQEWDQLGYDIPMMSINLSSSRLSQANVVDHFKWALDEAGFEPNRIGLEILENVIVEDAHSVISANVRRLSEAGFHISLDDFGTGRASISGLRHLALNRIKIDQTFVKGIDKDPELNLITGAMISLVKNLGMEVVCEGVEQEEERDVVAKLGCDVLQGYLISRPLSVEKVPIWVDGYLESLEPKQKIA